MIALHVLQFLIAIDPNPLAHLWWWIEIHLGITPKAPPAYYLAWSGSLSDIGEVTVIGGIVLAVRHINCHEKGCWRLGHMVPDSGLRTCHKHHPTHPRKRRNGSVGQMHRELSK